MIAVNRPTHRRIRPFNTKDTYPEQNLDNDLCQAVVANGVVYLRGQVGQDLDTGESIGIGDAGAQAERAMANIDLLLREAGSGLADIVKVIVYLTDARVWVNRFDVAGVNMYKAGETQYADGTRRFRTAHVEVARKNGKSTTIAGIALELAFFDGEPGARRSPAR